MKIKINTIILKCLTKSYLSFNLPTGNGCFAIITRFELESDRAGADVGDG